MAIIAGILSRRDLDSFLEPNFWLLLDGKGNDRQAADAATELVKARQLEDQDPVNVTGTRGSRGSQPVIVMTDINARTVAAPPKPTTPRPEKSPTPPASGAQQGTKEGAK